MKKKDWIALAGAAMGAVGSYLLAKAYVEKRKTCPPFRRKAYSDPAELVDTFGLFWDNPAALKSLKENARLRRPFVEKLLLTISGAHGARSKGGATAAQGLKAGLSPGDVGSLLQGEIGSASEEEAPALAFARQYADQGGDPDGELLAHVVDRYGATTARDIITYVRLIRAASLLGNTFDAFTSRLLGQPSPETTLRDELWVLSTFAFGILPLVPVLAVRAALSEPLEEPVGQEIIVLSG